MLELAEHLKSDRSHVARTQSLVDLAPDIVTAVMSGNAPKTLTLTKVLLCRACKIRFRCLKLLPTVFSGSSTLMRGGSRAYRSLPSTSAKSVQWYPISSRINQMDFSAKQKEGCVFISHCSPLPYVIRNPRILDTRQTENLGGSGTCQQRNRE